MIGVFNPTHRVQMDRSDYEVMLIDGAAYTKDEWNNYDRADFECTPTGCWLFLGEAFNGTVEEV